MLSYLLQFSPYLWCRFRLILCVYQCNNRSHCCFPGRTLFGKGLGSQKIAGNRRFQAIDQAVGKEGLKIVLLTRLSPIFPFNLLNYAFVVTEVFLKDYVIGKVGIIFGTIMYVYLGSLAGSLATLGTGSQSADPSVQWAIRILGFIATAAVTVYVTRIARKALEQEVLH